eukprot:1174404-Prorocentrum_minimum.AAC.1
MLSGVLTADEGCLSQRKFEGIENNIFTEVSTSKEKNFSCTDFIGTALHRRFRVAPHLCGVDEFN